VLVAQKGSEDILWPCKVPAETSDGKQRRVECTIVHLCRVTFE